MKVCNLYNIPSHYRKKIYQLMDEEYDCTFVFGDENLNVKTFDISCLKKATITHVSKIKRCAFQWAIVPLAFKNYDRYILTGATDNITQWLLLLLLKLYPEKKVYIWTHGIYGCESKKQLLVRRIFYRLVDGIFLYGEYAKCNIIKLGMFPKEKMFVLHNSLDYDKQLALRNKMSISHIYKEYFNNNNETLIFIGRLTKVKKLHILLDAVAKLGENGHNFNVVIVGNGMERQSLEEQSKKLNIEERVWFYGECYDEEENAELIYNADLCVSPGNVGLTALHCMMFGTPVITHNYFPKQMPEFEIVKDGLTGTYFEENNADSLALQISDWFARNKMRRVLVRDNCYRLIDEEWNPHFQMRVFNKALRNESLTD